MVVPVLNIKTNKLRYLILPVRGNGMPAKIYALTKWKWLIGEDMGTPKIACPLHKNTFSLETGENLNGSLDAIATYPVKIEEGFVYIGFSE